ncbi:hypothetical protein [Pontibacter sp. HJ8]
MKAKEFRQLCREVIALAGYLKNNPDKEEARGLLLVTAEKIKSAPPVTQETHE